MQAAVGDQVKIHSRTIDQADRLGEIVEVRGEQGGPPYVVRFSNGQQSLIYPGPDTEVKEP